MAVVAFEDLHWADPLTWDLFDFLARNLVDERVVLVGTYRANEVSANAQQRRRLGELARLPAVHRIHLGGLARDEVAARIEALTGRPAPFALVDEVFVRGQGNPFFTTELVEAHLAGQTIPAVLSDLIAADLAGLGRHRPVGPRRHRRRRTRHRPRPAGRVSPRSTRIGSRLRCGRRSPRSCSWSTLRPTRTGSGTR